MEGADRPELAPEDKKSKMAKRAKDKRVGGERRAFVRLKTLGQAGRPDLKVIHALFEEEKKKNSQDYKTAVSMAKASERVRTLGVHVGTNSAFGANSRDVRRSEMKRLASAVCDKSTSAGSDMQIQQLGDNILQLGMKVETSLSLARASMRHGEEQRRQQHERAMGKLVEFRHGKGAEALKELADTFPFLSTFRLQVEPLGPCLAVEALPPTADSVVDSIAWAHASGATNLGPGLEEGWMQMHQAVTQASGANVFPAEDASDPPPCYEAGVCLCSTEGKALKQVGDKLLKHMRERFKPKSKDRGLLLDGFVVLRIVGGPDTDDYETLLGPGGDICEVLLHVGLHYLKPFRPTFLELVCAEAGNEMPASNGRRYVKVCGIQTSLGTTTPKLPNVAPCASPSLVWPSGRICWCTHGGHVSELLLPILGDGQVPDLLGGDDTACEVWHIVRQLAPTGGLHAVDRRVECVYGSDRAAGPP